MMLCGMGFADGIMRRGGLVTLRCSLRFWLGTQGQSGVELSSYTFCSSACAVGIVEVSWTLVPS